MRGSFFLSNQKITVAPYSNVDVGLVCVVFIKFSDNHFSLNSLFKVIFFCVMRFLQANLHSFFYQR